MPPEVEPVHPQITEHRQITVILRAGQASVSAVANPVVVEMDAVWKSARRKAPDTDAHCPLNRRLTAITAEAANTPVRKTLNISEWNMVLPFCPGRKVDWRRVKFVPPSSIATISTDSMAELSNAAMLALRVLNPQVLQADMACVTASNHLIPQALSANAEITVIPMYIVSIIWTKRFFRPP